MFDVGFWELTIIGIVALVIVGPERLPKLARTAGLWIGKARRMVADVKRDIDREIKASEMSDIKEGLETARKEVNKAGEVFQKATETEELQSTIKEVAKEAAPVKADIESDLDEIDQIAQQMDSEIQAATTEGDAGLDQDHSSASGVHQEFESGAPPVGDNRP